MKQLEQLAEALRELTDRYGITMTEVPERLREKILQKVDAETGTYLDVLMLPLVSNLLRPLRVRAGNRVEKSVVVEVIRSVAELDGYDMQLAETVVRIWMTVFLVSEGDLLVTICDEKYDEVITPIAAPVKPEPTPEKSLRTPEPGKRHYTTSESKNKTATSRGGGGYETDERSVRPASHSGDILSEFLTDNKKKKLRSDLDQKSERTVDKHKNAVVKPLMPDTMAYQPAGAAKVSNSDKTPGLNEAFRRLRNGDYQMASKLMMELARAGDSRAQFHLGEFYLAGTGVEQNDDKAKYWFRKAAAQGSLPAKNKVADLEAPEEKGGCLSCAFAVFLIFVIIKFFASVF